VKFLLTVALAIVLLSVESVVVKYLGFSVVRIDVTVVIIAFLALRAGTLEGAFAAFAVGYLLDLMSGQPTGLYTFLAVLVFLLGRLGSSLVDVRSAASFAVFAVGMDVTHSLLASFFMWLTSRGVGVGFSLSSLVAQMLLTGLAALLLYPLLRKMDPGSERPEVGSLR
jgi:rod shape-determining protein MreD